MFVVQIIALIFVAMICLGIIGFLYNVWKKWMIEMDRNHNYQIDYLVARERTREQRESRNNIDAIESS